MIEQAARKTLGPAVAATSGPTSQHESGDQAARSLMEEEIHRSELVEVGLPMASERSYFLMYPDRNENLPALMAFHSWLTASTISA